MTTWHMEVKQGFGILFSAFITESSDRSFILLGEMLSAKYPQERVTLTCQARVRMAWENGALVADNDDLRKFYTGISDQDAHSWKTLGHLWTDDIEEYRARVAAGV